MDLSFQILRPAKVGILGHIMYGESTFLMLLKMRKQRTGGPQL